MLNITYIRELQIKTIMTCHLTPVRMVISKRSKDNKHWQGGRSALYTVSGNVNLYSHYGKYCRHSSKYLKLELPYKPEIPPLDI
jgi:hypothetical protein